MRLALVTLEMYSGWLERIFWTGAFLDMTYVLALPYLEAVMKVLLTDWPH